MKKLFFMLAIFLTGLFGYLLLPHGLPFLTAHANCVEDANCPVDPPPYRAPPGPGPKELAAIAACKAQATPCTLAEQIQLVEAIYSGVEGGFTVVNNADGSVTITCANGAYIVLTQTSCGTPCSSPAECQSAINGCTACVSGTCQSPVTPTPTIPPACGAACPSDTYCQSAQDGCTACIGGVCKPPPACNTPCNTPAECTGAQNGCTACLPGIAASSSAGLVASGSATASNSGTQTQTTCQPPGNACGIDCKASPTICQQAGTGAGACNTCLPNPNGTGNNICQPPPACGTDCTNNPTVCQQAGTGCTQCLKNPNGSGSACGQAACGTDCTNDPTVCSPASGGCSQCVDNGNGTKACGSPIACGTDCSTNKAICQQSSDGCNACISGKCAVDTFTPAMCACDGMDTPPSIISGQAVIFTAYSKITGTDTAVANMQSMNFQLFAGSTQIASSGAITPVAVSQTGAGTRYKASWTVTLPSTIKTGVTYQVVVGRACVRQPFAMAPVATSARKVVLAASTGGGFFSNILNAITNFFGLTGTTTTNPAATVPTPTTPSNGQGSLQLQTFHLSKNVSSTCSYTSWEFQ